MMMLGRRVNLEKKSHTNTTTQSSTIKSRKAKYQNTNSLFGHTPIYRSSEKLKFVEHVEII